MVKEIRALLSSMSTLEWCLTVLLIAIIIAVHIRFGITAFVALPANP